MGWVVVKLVLYILFVNTSTGEHISRAERLLFSNSRLPKGDSWVLWIKFSYKFRQSETGRKACPAAALSLLEYIPWVWFVHPCKYLDSSFCSVFCLDFWAVLFLMRRCHIASSTQGLPLNSIWNSTRQNVQKKTHMMMPKVNTCSRHIKL